jgi:hypothetical protein
MLLSRWRQELNAPAFEDNFDLLLNLLFGVK